MRVLIADEDRSLVDVLPPLLRREGHQVVLRAGRGDLAEVVLAEGIHLLIFEPALMPFGWAVQLCRTLRRESATMVLAVSRMAGVAERVRALEAGADDYLTKPFDPEEALARVHALLRRHPLNVVVHGASLVRVTETLSLDLAGQRLVGAQGGDAAGEILLSDREFRCWRTWCGTRAPSSPATRCCRRCGGRGTRGRRARSTYTCATYARKWSPTRRPRATYSPRGDVATTTSGPRHRPANSVRSVGPSRPYPNPPRERRRRQHLTAGAVRRMLEFSTTTHGAWGTRNACSPPPKANVGLFQHILYRTPMACIETL